MDSQPEREEILEERISRYLDDEMTLDEASEIVAEIDRSPEAAKVALELQVASNALSDWFSGEKGAETGAPAIGESRGTSARDRGEEGGSLLCFRCGGALEPAYVFCPRCGAGVRAASKAEFFPGFQLGGIFNDVRREMWLILAIASGVGAMVSQSYFKQLWLACAICGAKWAMDQLFLKLADIVRERSFGGEVKEQPAGTALGKLAARAAVRLVGPDGLAALAVVFFLASFKIPARHESLIILSGLCGAGWILLGPSLRAVVKIFRALAEDNPKKLARLGRELSQIRSGTQRSAKG